MILECIKSTTDNSIAVATVIIAASAVVIAALTCIILYSQTLILKGQRKDSQYKIKVDLFNKRMEVYQVVKDQLRIAAADSKPKINYAELNSAQSKARFLFDDKIHKAIEKIVETIITQETASRNLSTVLSDPQPDPTQINNFSNLKSNAAKALLAASYSFDDIFSDFMTLNKI